MPTLIDWYSYHNVVCLQSVTCVALLCELLKFKLEPSHLSEWRMTFGFFSVIKKTLTSGQACSPEYQKRNIFFSLMKSRPRDQNLGRFITRRSALVKMVKIERQVYQVLWTDEMQINLCQNDGKRKVLGKNKGADFSSKHTSFVKHCAGSGLAWM